MPDSAPEMSPFMPDDDVRMAVLEARRLLKELRAAAKAAGREKRMVQDFMDDVMTSSRGHNHVSYSINSHVVPRPSYSPTDLPYATKLFGSKLDYGLSHWKGSTESFEALCERLAYCRPAPDRSLQHAGHTMSVIMRLTRDLFSIPVDSTVEGMRAHGRPLVEIASGSGYFAHTMRAGGIDIVATDIAPSEGLVELTDIRPEVVTLPGAEAVDRFQDRDVVLVMPREGDRWFVDAVARITQPGRRLFLVPDISRDMLDTPRFRSNPDQCQDHRAVWTMLDNDFTKAAGVPFIAAMSAQDIRVFERR